MVSLDQLTTYLRRQLKTHFHFFFDDTVSDWLEGSDLRFMPYGEALQCRDRAIVLPFDINSSIEPGSSYHVRFNDTELTLWNPLPPPSGPGWATWPDSGSPLWFIRNSGTVVPAWNIFTNLTDLLTFREERESILRERHGRFPSSASPRMANGLLRVPAFNEAAAAILGALLGLRKNGRPEDRLDGYVKTPALILSHDCDILRGDDVMTQSIRLANTVLPILRGNYPNPSKLLWIARNAVFPRKYYFENIAGMIDIERQFGFHSAFYFLTGSGGRFGARSGRHIVDEAIRSIPEGWEVGMHYNYDTFLDAKRFQAQRKELEMLAGRPIIAGRAHYLRFDPERSFAFLRQNGIYLDESAGYPDYTGYRAGIAGPFRPLNLATGIEEDIWEVPMVFMDSTQASERRYAHDAHFEKMLYHLSKIGGMASVLFHTGGFFNPEHPDIQGLFVRNLSAAYHLGSRCFTPNQLLQESLR